MPKIFPRYGQVMPEGLPGLLGLPCLVLISSALFQYVFCRPGPWPSILLWLVKRCAGNIGHHRTPDISSSPAGQSGEGKGRALRSFKKPLQYSTSNSTCWSCETSKCVYNTRWFPQKNSAMWIQTNKQKEVENKRIVSFSDACIFCGH